MVKTEKSYKNRFGNYKAGICPYCSVKGATLTAKPHGRFIGKCPECKAMNNFTNPLCVKWNEDL
jgi:phage FluMu protein Com